MIVTISGKPGSGKSTTARELSGLLDMKHRSAGDFMREMASERGISVLELSAIAETDGGIIDREIDERTRLLGQAEDGFLIDSRLAWHFIPNSLKVFLDVNLEVAAVRIFGERRGSEAENTDLRTTASAIDRRLRSETTRYKDYYGIDWLDFRHYDLVVDTSGLTVAQVVADVLGFVSSRP
jgi:cytidylate kinase